MNAFPLFSEPFTNALGWALVHTLWQATLLVAVTALALRLTQAQRASVRYGISIGALALQFLTFLMTFWVCYEPVRATMTIGGEQPALVGQSTLVMNLPAGRDWLGELTSRLNQYVPLLVTVWLCGTLVLLIRLVGGWLFVQRLTRRNLSPVPEAWQNYLQQVARQLGISGAVRLMESAEITVPMTIGWLKPVVLIPIGLLAGLSPRQVEAVLAHELAHIRRYDYLVNLVQSLVEIVLFFHPAIWWLSARIREEREHCCDDVAIQLCGERTSLAQALVHLEERRQSVADAPSLAMAFGARRQSFIQRVKRVIGVREPQSAMRPNGLAVAGFLVLLAGLVAGQHSHRSTHPSRRASDSITINTWHSDPAIQPFVAQERKEAQQPEPILAIENDTINPVEQTRIEQAVERHAQEMERLGREMEKLYQELDGHEPAIELTEKEMQKMQAELEPKRAQLESRFRQAESQWLAKLHAEVAQSQKRINELNAGKMAQLQEKLRTLQDKGMQLPDDSIKAFWEEAVNQMNAEMPHLIKAVEQSARKLDSLRERRLPTPVMAPAPAVSPRPARAPKPAGGKGQYWYNGKRYDNPADMPAVPAPPMPPAEPGPATVEDPIAPVAAPAVPTPPQLEAVPDAPAPPNVPKAPKAGKKGRHIKTNN
ncbi:beta-lactamase regulating signal transducer with metallopeptidase domain [Larkinella arboricola]|uniref:Beta-lactamase regulating signal transducer with metallopeptidase domain n=1 Tax=Larkinella arboricola TaxID=643671 RepID=A0A327WUD0_LARAB|nr:M56 family metallopeptidase [Larkinella arboricola]RAJ92496.1 beta-lactamase regulating signal transducer with metallopeptidase domain [Larkinella arboricola]